MFMVGVEFLEEFLDDFDMNGVDVIYIENS